jgi:hypothetical protein
MVSVLTDVVIHAAMLVSAARSSKDARDAVGDSAASKSIAKMPGSQGQ